MASDVKLATKFGDVYVTVFPEHLFVTNHPDREVFPFSVRGIPYRMTAHVYRHSDGTFRVGQERTPGYSRIVDGTYITRTDKNSDTSFAARNAIVAEIESVINAWVPGLLAQSHFRAARSRERANAIAKLQGDINELRAKLDAKIEDLAKLESTPDE